MEGLRAARAVRLLGIGMLLALSSLTVVPEAGTAHTLHGPIYIEGNGNFTAANGVTGGSGSYSDPYVIEGWEIDASAANGIEMHNTTAHFVIRGVYVHSGDVGYYAIHVRNVSNGHVEGSTILSSLVGVDLHDTTNMSIISNNISTNLQFGIYLWKSTNVTISGNDLLSNVFVPIKVDDGRSLTVTSNNMRSNGGGGYYSSGSFDALIADNRISSSSNDGMMVWGGNLTITGNEVSGTDIGMWVMANRSHNDTIRGNRVSNNNMGMYLRMTYNATVSDNLLYRNGEGMVLEASGGVSVYHNNFINNTNQASDDNGPENAWDDGYPSGGNYWSDYTGPDTKSGPNQDQPGSDGIGDLPYGLDNYPLMEATLPDLPPSPPVMLPAQLVGPGLGDVLVSWLASGDDGWGENDIAGYEVWSGDWYDSTAATYTPIAMVPAGTTSYLQVGAGAGDTANRFYQVRAIDNSSQSIPSADQAGKYTKALGAGMRLISVPLEQANWSIESVLQTVNWTRAWTRSSVAGEPPEWLSNDPGKTWSDLTALDRETAFWLELPADSQWTVAGLVPRSTQIALRSGWNLVGYPSFVPRTVADALAGVSYETVEGFAGDPPYYLRRMAPANTMSPGDGYWLYVSADAVIVVLD